jgi:hypothetical protein
MRDRSIVPLPAEVRSPFDVYLNGVLQRLGEDYDVRGGALHFRRRLAKDKIAKWRWAIGAIGVGTYRQNDSVDVRYEINGQPRLVQGLDIEPG